jgi:hypothetical protein
MEHEFYEGLPIYYIDSEGNHWPGKILQTRVKIKVRINHLKKDKIIWAKPCNIEEQQEIYDHPTTGKTIYKG